MCATLTWSTRMKIALDAAKGLAFLHGAERPIIYRDFKTSNILLDAVSHQFLVVVLTLYIVYTSESSKAYQMEDKGIYRRSLFLFENIFRKLYFIKTKKERKIKKPLM